MSAPVVRFAPADEAAFRGDLYEHDVALDHYADPQANTVFRRNGNSDGECFDFDDFHDDLRLPHKK